jgi:adenine/guanine phosphoribosyltransferase-like PRPP-binding protein
LARLLSEWLGLPITGSVVQSNTVGHTGASGFQRLANQALFEGELERGCSYLLVDDFIGQGGTLANLIGYVERAGGHAVGATS